MSKVIGIKKLVTSPTAKRNANQPYWLLDVLVGPLHRARAAKYLVFLTGNAAVDTAITEHMDAQVASGVFDQTLQLDYVTVGDTDSNPNTTPLPAVYTKDENGVVGKTIHTSMQVLMEFEGGKMIGSPRAKAIGIIDTMCELAKISHNSPEMVGPDPING